MSLDISLIDEKVNSILASRPWLKMVLAALTFVLGAGRARGYFAQKFGVR